MKRKLCLATVILAIVCVCAMLTACVPFPEQVDKGNKKLDAPIDIVIENVTSNAIFVFDVLYGEEGGGETEISIDGEVWIDFDNSVGYEFDGLLPNTEYTISARQKSYGEYQVSDVFSKKIRTEKINDTRVPENVTAAIYHGVVSLNGVTDEMEVSYDNGATYSSDTTHTFTEKGEKTILVRYKATTDYLAGADLRITVTYNDFAGGSGTESDPYLIENFEQFMAINKINYSGSYKLLEDIVFPETAVTEIIVFSGTFFGNNKKLIAPRFDYSSNAHYNAFGGIFHTNGSETKICDLIVENAEITTYASNQTHGLLINCAKEISNCKVSGKIILSCMNSRSYAVGGLCGKIEDNGSVIRGCHSDVMVEIASDISLITEVSVGGLVGTISDDCTIENSNAKICALFNENKFYNGYVGGLVGSVENAQSVTISKSWAETDLKINAIYCFTGGLVALSPNTDIANCYATGNIVASGSNISRGSKCVSGGISAGVEQDSANCTGNIVNCYSAVNIIVDRSNSAIVASGIICNASAASDKKIENCLYVGKITVEGSGLNAVNIDAVALKSDGYDITNNYIVEASAEGMELGDNVVSVSAEELTANWFKQTLNFDETVWTLTDGKLPELK